VHFTHPHNLALKELDSETSSVIFLAMEALYSEFTLVIVYASDKILVADNGVENVVEMGWERYPVYFTCVLTNNTADWVCAKLALGVHVDSYKDVNVVGIEFL
jgi:hypothetical protein